MKYFTFSNVFIDGKSLQSLFIGFGPAEAVFITKPNNFPEAIMGRVGRHITARAQKSRNKTGRCKPVLTAVFDSSHFKDLRMLLLKVTHMPGPVKDAVKAQEQILRDFLTPPQKSLTPTWLASSYLLVNRYKVKSKDSGLIDFLLLYPLVERIRCLRDQLLQCI